MVIIQLSLQGGFYVKRYILLYKMSIRGELETDGGKKKIKYPFQKIAIVIALALWTITAINILYSRKCTLSGKKEL